MSGHRAPRPQPARRHRHPPLGHPGRQQVVGADTIDIAVAVDLKIRNTGDGTVTIDGGGLNRVSDVDPAGSAAPFTVTFRGLVMSPAASPASTGRPRARE